MDKATAGMLIGAAWLIAAAISFGLWLHSIAAALFFFCVVQVISPFMRK